MKNFEELEQEFWQIDRGTPRLQAIREAIIEADLQQDLDWCFWFRYDYIKESIFCGDRYFALITFPELLNLYQTHQELYNYSYVSHDVLICFRWIVEAVVEFPNISKQEIDSYFKLFKKMLLEQGKSLSIYYMKRSYFYLHVDKNIATADFYRFLREPLDDISEGKTFYYHHQVLYYLLMNKEEKALQSAKLIFEGKLQEDFLLEYTYHKFMKFYLEHENYEKALYYAELMISKVNGNAYYLHMIGDLMSVYSVCDIPKGLVVFTKNYNFYLQSKNPWLKMHFAIGAY
ncbi:MAG: hypothetical protein K2G88_07445, partial [Oscillospiraceae bacterium]|nr:hypothetical protein [Oscillospiraceae bacterium]